MLFYLTLPLLFAWQRDLTWRTASRLASAAMAVAMMASFLFGLLLLSVTGRLGEWPLAPWLPVWAIFLLTLSCAVALLYFINYAAVRRDVNTVLAQILADLKKTLQELSSVSAPASTSGAVSSESEFSLLSPASGYLQRVDYELLSQAALSGSAVITFLRRPGDFVLAGSILAVGSLDGNQGPFLGQRNCCPRHSQTQ